MPTATRTATKWRMISQTAEYALRAVLHLAGKSGGRPLSAADAAAAISVPERYLARVLNELARSGVLISTRGAQGGFRLARPAGELTLATVVAPFDAAGDAPQCLLRNQQCGEGESCLAHQRWHDVSANVRRFFQTTTIADLIDPVVDNAGAPDLLVHTRQA